MAKHRQREQPPAATVTTADPLDDRARRAPSWEDAEAQPDTEEQNSAPLVVPTPPADAGPNPDLTPPANLTCADPLWTCTCPDELCIPKRTIQAPTAALAEERYRQAMLIRRPTVKVEKL